MRAGRQWLGTFQKHPTLRMITDCLGLLLLQPVPALEGDPILCIGDQGPFSPHNTLICILLPAAMIYTQLFIFREGCQSLTE